MTREADDAAWLAALAGQPEPEADPALTQQALALRQALIRRRDALQQAVPPADEALLRTLQQQLRSEGLDRASSRPGMPMPANMPLWSLAATVLLGVGALLQLDGALREQSQADVLRGGDAQVVQLTVAQPEQALAQWLAELPPQADPRVRRLANGRIELDLAARPEVLDALAAKRLEPMPRDGRVRLVLRPGRAASASASDSAASSPSARSLPSPR